MPDESNHESEAPEPSQPVPPPVGSTVSHDFDQLSQGEKELQITYRGQVYRLRRTRNERLILTK